MTPHDELRRLLGHPELAQLPRPLALVRVHPNANVNTTAYHVRTADEVFFAEAVSEADAALIVAAVNALPALLDEVEALGAERDDARAVGLRVCRIAHDLVTTSGSGEYSAINAAREQLGLDVRDIATQLRDSETRARNSERAFDELTAKNDTLAAECQRLRAEVERLKQAAENVAVAVADFVRERLDWDRSTDAALYAIPADIYSGKWRASEGGIE